MPAISDVAARAGVSTATVSRALNGKSTVDPDLAARVRAAATELGYQPNGPARNLRRQEAAVDRPLPGQDSDVVLVDTRLAAAHLVAQGYERIGCITGPAGVRTADDRLAGYRDALNSARRRSTPKLVRRTEYKAAGAHRAALDLLSQPEPPDALLIANSAPWRSVSCNPSPPGRTDPGLRFLAKGPGRAAIRRDRKVCGPRHSPSSTTIR